MKNKKAKSKSKDNSQDKLYDYKVIILGWSSVGKTSIIQRFLQNKFTNTHLATLGVDYSTIKMTVDNYNIKLRIWDTAGQERYNKVTNQYLKGSDGVLLVYDITSEQSFKSIDSWIEQITVSLDLSETGLVLLGNKCDLEKERTISVIEGREMGNKLNIKYFETSAKDGTNIKEAFQHLVREILIKKNQDYEGRKTFTISGDNLKKKKCPLC